MPRLRQVPRAEADKSVLPVYDLLFGDRDPVASPGTATGTPGDWWTVFALVPEVFEHAVRGFALYRNPARKIDPKLRELGQTRVGWARAPANSYIHNTANLAGLRALKKKRFKQLPIGKLPSASLQSSAQYSPTPTHSYMTGAESAMVFSPH